ncbi:MAG: tripartite tricarboxylate transporter TctB family protein [Dictyoglomaceae bacterium]|nr:tripartite tricarboxylate transporter TctB family protein [Dictyoglomaceae bacterium]
MKGNKDLITSIIIILCGVLFLVEASHIKNLGFDILDTSFFPKLTSYLLIISGIGLFINNLLKQRGKEGKNIEIKENLLKIFIFVLFFVLYLLILPLLHFIFATILFILASYLIIDPSLNLKNMAKGIILSLLLSYGFWFIFVKGFNVLLP